MSHESALYADPHRPPVPNSPPDAARWRHTRMRRRLLDGDWLDDLVHRLQEDVGTVRREAWGVPKLTSNPFGVMCRELSALYSVAPQVFGPGGVPILGNLERAVRKSGLWSAMTEFQARVLGCREYLMRVAAQDDGRGGRVHYRPVPPDMVLAASTADEPDEPVRIQELRWREGYGWAWDILDVSDPALPVYRVETWKGEDISEPILGGRFEGEAYPYQDDRRAPILPYVLYHAGGLRDRLWDWLRGVETVEATLDLAVLYTFLGHVMRDCSWPQRYVVNAQPMGMDTESAGEAGARAGVVTDPATLLPLLQVADTSGQVLVGQWQSGADPEKLEAVISAMANRIAVDAGLPPSDIQRLGGTARSGYAIALSNEGKRVAARRYAPLFSRFDERLMATTATLLNRAVPESALPEGGYSVLYQDLPLSPEEMQARRQDVMERLEKQLMSPSDALMELHPGMTRDQAVTELGRIHAEHMAMRALAMPSAPPAPMPEPNGSGEVL